MNLPTNFTEMLKASRGNQADLDEFYRDIYRELRLRAGAYMRRERPNHTLQPTALINEAYIRLAKQAPQNWRNRAHFIAFAANAMRQVLVDYARERRAIKRGGDQERVTLSEAIAGEERDVDLISLDDALAKLETIDPSGAQLILLRFFGGLTKKELSEVLGDSESTVKRRLRALQAWLRSEIG